MPLLDWADSIDPEWRDLLRLNDTLGVRTLVVVCSFSANQAISYAILCTRRIAVLHTQGSEANMLRKRYYILFVARDEDGRVRKISLPLHYAYGFVAAALVGAFTIVGLAGSYTRMLLKTETFNQVRQERETLRKDNRQMAQIVHDRDVQVASLGALANEVTALYGLKQSRLGEAKVAPLSQRSDRTHAHIPCPDQRREPAAGQALHRSALRPQD